MAECSYRVTVSCCQHCAGARERRIAVLEALIDRAVHGAVEDSGEPDEGWDAWNEEARAALAAEEKT